MGMLKSRHAHHSRIFINSNWNTDSEHAPFSSPGSLKSVFQRAMAFGNKRDNRSYAQVLSSQCDSPFHKIDKWSSSIAGSCYMDSTSASGGQYSNKTHQFGGSKRGVLYKECKQLCWCHIKLDPACQVCTIVLKNGQGSADSMDVQTAPCTRDKIHTSDIRKPPQPNVTSSTTRLVTNFNELALSNRFEALATNSDVQSDTQMSLSVPSDSVHSLHLQRSVCSDDKNFTIKEPNTDATLVVPKNSKARKTDTVNTCLKIHEKVTTDNDIRPVNPVHLMGNLDQFVRPPKSQQKWYGFHPNPKKDSDQTVSSWHTGASRLNSTYLRIARQAGIASSPPMSCPISQESLRKWERSAHESTVSCNHAASFNRCLLKIQNMNSQLKAIRVESKGETAATVSSAVDELQFLLDFNSSVCQAMAKSMEHLTEFVFVNMANTTLLRHDSYLAYLKAGVKANTLHALRTAPLQLDTLFQDSVVKRAEEDITGFDKGRSSSVYKGRRYHPYERQDSKTDSRQERPAWKNLSRTQRRKQKGRHQYSSRPAKGQQQRK